MSLVKKTFFALAAVSAEKFFMLDLLTQIERGGEKGGGDFMDWAVFVVVLAFHLLMFILFVL